MNGIKQFALYEAQNMKRRLYIITVIILLVGLSSAVLIYLTAENDSKSILGYEIVDGHAYPIEPGTSKKYIHDLERYGGKANVLADEFIRWFAGLWQGKSLAFTIAGMTILISLSFFFVANQMPSDLKSDAKQGNDREKPG